MSEFHYEHQSFDSHDYSGEHLLEQEYDACTFRNCKFAGTDLSGSVFKDCDFISCQFTETTFNHTGLRDVTFRDCKLIGLELADCHHFLIELSFYDCHLDYCNFQGLPLQKTVFDACKMPGVDFSQANLKEAVFHNCTLEQAIFEQTNLEKADFRTAVHYVLDPELNRIRGARFAADGLSGLLQKYRIRIG